MNHDVSIRMELLPLLAGALPLIAIGLSYLTAVSAGHVDGCMPLWEGCTTISAVGRKPPESMLFKGLMSVAAVFLLLYWYGCYLWLGVAGGKRSGAVALLLVLGTLSAVFLLVYTTALGHIGEQYYVQRRVGVTLFFLCGFIAQLIQLLKQWRLYAKAEVAGIRRPLRWQLVIVLLLFVVGVGNFVSHHLLGAEKWLDNVIEWNFALLSSLFVLVTCFVWRTAGFRAVIETGGAAG